MKFLSKCKNKKVISIVLVFIVSFCTILAKPTKTYAQENNNNTRIEMTNQNIDNKGVDKMRSEFVTINGKTYQARKMDVKATAYTSAPNEGGAYAYNGERLRDGHIAADLRVLPIGTKVYIPSLNKIYTVVDTGSAIKNNKIDIWMRSKSQCIQWGVRNITIYVLE